MKIKYSALVSDARGKLNGSVASKNRYGNYLRNKVTPVNPQSIFQQSIRAIFGSMAGLWRGLTQNARNGWITAAQNFPFTDIFGDVKYLSGQALFTKLNTNLVKLGTPAVLTPPSPTAIPEITVGSVQVLATDGVLDQVLIALNSAVPAGFRAVVYATPPIVPGQKFVKNKYRMLGSLAPAAEDGDFTTEYSNHFGTSAPLGRFVYVRVQFVALVNGQAGAVTTADTVVEAA